MIRLTPEGSSAPVLNLERERAASMTLVLMHCGDIRPSRTPSGLEVVGCPCRHTWRRLALRRTA